MIPISSTARWMAAMAAADGVVTPSERRLLSDFADHYGIEVKSLYRMAYAIANQIDIPEVEFVGKSAMKGRLFEDFVVSLLSDRSRFKLLAWRSDKIVGEVFPLENLLPDLHVRHRIDETTVVEYFIECKFRSSWVNDEIDLSDQYARYHIAAKKSNLELFIALGIGGTPSLPDEFYLIPGRMIGLSKKIDKNIFQKCRCEKKTDDVHSYVCHYFQRRIFNQ